MEKIKKEIGGNKYPKKYLPRDTKKFMVLGFLVISYLVSTTVALLAINFSGLFLASLELLFILIFLLIYIKFRYFFTFVSMYYPICTSLSIFFFLIQGYNIYILLYGNCHLYFLMSDFLLFLYVLFSIMRMLQSIRKSGRLPYIFLTIYMGSLGVLLLCVLFLYIYSYTNMATYHSICEFFYRCASWCSRHSYIITFLMELEFILQLVLFSLVVYMIDALVSIIVDMKIKTLMHIRESSYQFSIIVSIALYGVKEKEGKTENLEVINITRNINLKIQFLIVGLILFFYMLSLIREAVKNARREMNERLPYLFLTIYLGSLAILLIFVCLLYIINFVNMGSYAILCGMFNTCVSWCSEHTYIIRHIGELNLGAQFLILSSIIYVAWVGVSALIDIKVKTLIKIRESLYLFADIFRRTFYR